MWINLILKPQLLIFQILDMKNNYREHSSEMIEMTHNSRRMMTEHWREINMKSWNSKSIQFLKTSRHYQSISQKFQKLSDYKTEYFLYAFLSSMMMLRFRRQFWWGGSAIKAMFPSQAFTYAAHRMDKCCLSSANIMERTYAM